MYSKQPNNPMQQPQYNQNPQQYQQVNVNSSHNNFQTPQNQLYQQQQQQQIGGVVQPPPQIPDTLFNQGQQIVQPPEGELNQINHLPQIPGCLDGYQDLDMNQQWWSNWERNQDNLKLNENYRMFLIQKMNLIADSTVIGVVDQSGSMSDCFHHLAKEWNAQVKDKFPNSKCVTFHNFAQLVPKLEEHPEMGTTDVEGGFRLLNNVIQDAQNTKDFITIVFISDGMDNNPSTIYQRLDQLISQIPRGKKINFITIGVGDQFPTYLAMQLRQMYHNGENNIPPVFLVLNQHIHENWKVTFNIVSKYLRHNAPVQFDKQVQQFPWTKPQNYAFEESYVFTTDMSVTSLNYCGVQIKHAEKLAPQQVIDISRVLLSNAQLSNLKFGTNDHTKAEVVVAEAIEQDLKKQFWGKKNKKKEEKEQLKLVEDEMKNLKEDPDLKSKKNKPAGDSHLAAKLAIGAVGAGLGAYWLVSNYGEFVSFLGNLDFGGVSDCGCFGDLCGNCGGIFESCGCDCDCEFLGNLSDNLCGACSCDCCGDCFSNVIESGKGCIGDSCKAICELLGHIASSICGLLS